jgi:hypothetical protein
VLSPRIFATAEEIGQLVNKHVKNGRTRTKSQRCSAVFSGILLAYRLADAGELIGTRVDRAFRDYAGVQEGSHVVKS